MIVKKAWAHGLYQIAFLPYKKIFGCLKEGELRVESDRVFMLLLDLRVL